MCKDRIGTDGNCCAHETVDGPVVKAPTTAELVVAMKVEVNSMIESGLVPSDVKSFADLHDYCDANCLANLCNDAVFDALVKQHGGRDVHEGMPQGMLDVINAAQTEVDAWIRSGRKAPQEPGAGGSN